MQLSIALVSILCALAPAVSAINCEKVSGGPGPEAVKAVKNFFLRDYVHGKVCPPGQDQISGKNKGKWCGICKGARIDFANQAGTKRCFTKQDVNNLFNNKANLHGDVCSYHLKKDQYLHVLYGKPDSVYEKCNNHC